MEPYLGQIQAFGFNFAPRGWLNCSGQILQISTNTALFSLLGTRFGGDGRISFGIPDLRSAVPVHPGAGPGLRTIVWGEIGGIDYTRLTLAQMPTHNHSITKNLTARFRTSSNSYYTTEVGSGDTSLAAEPENSSPIYSESPNNGDWLHGGTAPLNAQIGLTETGNNSPFDIRQPYTGINYCISLTGIFPSRN